MVLETITKWWIAWACAIIAALLAVFQKKIKETIAHVRELRKQEKDNNMKNTIVEAVKPMMDQWIEHSDEKDAEIRATVSELSDQIKIMAEKVDLVTEGTLTVQGSVFRQLCRSLLKQEESITEDQYEKCMHEHTVYNKLGGNHEGDQLFSLVTKKYENQLGGK